jgi:hypothetical protein
LFGEVHEWQLRGRGVTVSSTSFNKTHHLLCSRSQTSMSYTTTRVAALCCPHATSAVQCAP